MIIPGSLIFTAYSTQAAETWQFYVINPRLNFFVTLFNTMIIRSGKQESVKMKSAWILKAMGKI